MAKVRLQAIGGGDPTSTKVAAALLWQGNVLLATLLPEGMDGEATTAAFQKKGVNACGRDLMNTANAVERRAWDDVLRVPCVGCALAALVSFRWSRVGAVTYTDVLDKLSVCECSS